jgi:hypothetical protein
MCLPLWWLSRAVGALVGAVLGRRVRCGAYAPSPQRPHVMRRGSASPRARARASAATHQRTHASARAAGAAPRVALPPLRCAAPPRTFRSSRTGLGQRLTRARARAPPALRSRAPPAFTRTRALYQSGLEVTCGGQRDFRLWEGVPGHSRHLVGLHRAAILFWDALDATGYRTACHRRERCVARALPARKALRGAAAAAHPHAPPLH